MTLTTTDTSRFLPLSSVHEILFVPSSGMKNCLECASADFRKRLLIYQYTLLTSLPVWQVSRRGSGFFLLIKYSAPLVGEVMRGAPSLNTFSHLGIMWWNLVVCNPSLFIISLHIRTYLSKPFLFIASCRRTEIAEG